VHIDAHRSHILCTLRRVRFASGEKEGTTEHPIHFLFFSLAPSQPTYPSSPCSAVSSPSFSSASATRIVVIMPVTFQITHVTTTL